MLLLVISDLHLGTGHFLENGMRNILEDFQEDDRFCEFTEYYSTEKYKNDSVHLVLNGDIFNLIGIDVDDEFTHIQDDEWCVKAMKKIVK